MKRIELTLHDIDTRDLMVALSGFNLNSLTITTLDAEAEDEKVAAIAAYIERQGEALQANGRRNSLLTAKELAAGIRAGNWQPSDINDWPDDVVMAAGPDVPNGMVTHRQVDPASGD